jgi:hypothetical protein
MRSLQGERRAAAVTAASLAILFAGVSASAADTEPIRVRFEAPSDCPGEAAFLDQVRARTAKARVAAASEKARTFAVRLAHEGRSIHGRLAIEESASQTEIREITGERCAEVVSALALITALAVDPQASTAPPARLPTAPPAPALPPFGSDPAAPGGAGASPPPPPPPPPQPPRARLPPNHPAPYVRPPSWVDLDASALPVIPAIPVEIPPLWRFTAGVEIAAVGGFAPPPLAAGSAFFVEAALTDRRAITFAPSLRFALIQADSGYLGPAPIIARFQLHLARGEVCPLRFVLLEGLAIAPCASFDLGALLAQGWASAQSGESQRLWAAPGLGARLRWTIAGEIELQLEGGGSIPLVNDTFLVAPDILVHQVPAFAPWLAAGAGVHFY